MEPEAEGTFSLSCCTHLEGDPGKYVYGGRGGPHLTTSQCSALLFNHPGFPLAALLQVYYPPRSFYPFRRLQNL